MSWLDDIQKHRMNDFSYAVMGSLNKGASNSKCIYLYNGLNKLNNWNFLKQYCYSYSLDSGENYGK